MSEPQHYRGMPKRLKIGSYIFRVEVEEFEDSEADRTFGHMNPINQKIRLRPGMTRQNLANTFIHEVIHAIHWANGALHMALGDAEADVEELYTLTGANGLCALWQDNPEALRWWVRVNNSQEV